MIKVIASDMDGTLLGNDHKVAPETLKAIHEACDAGIRFMIATGRNFKGAMEELKETDIVCDYIVGSGAQIACQQTFIAFGNSKISAFLAMFRKIIVLIPLIYILPVFLEDHVQAVFLAEPIADVIAVVTTLLLFRKNFKKVLSEMKQKSETQDV